MTFIGKITPEELEGMFVSAADVSRATGWPPNLVAARMQQMHKRGVMVASRPVYYKTDLDEVLKRIKEDGARYPMAPSLLPQSERQP